MSHTPRPYDAILAAALADLAAFITDEWDRTQARKERERHRRESHTARAVFNAVIRNILASVVVMDRDYRVLDCSPLWAAGIGVPADRLPRLFQKFEQADDNAVNQLVLKTLLNQAGIEPVIVADGAAAVEAYRTQDWDLISDGCAGR